MNGVCLLSCYLVISVRFSGNTAGRISSAHMQSKQYFISKLLLRPIRRIHTSRPYGDIHGLCTTLLSHRRYVLQLRTHRQKMSRKTQLSSQKKLSLICADNIHATSTRYWFLGRNIGIGDDIDRWRCRNWLDPLRQN